MKQCWGVGVGKAINGVKKGCIGGVLVLGSEWIGNGPSKKESGGIPMDLLFFLR